jgi:hypothetical protein
LLYFDERAIRHSFCYLCVAVTEYYICQLPKGFQFVRPNVAEVLFLKTIGKYSPSLEPEEDNRTRAARFPFASTCDALLDDYAT